MTLQQRCDAFNAAYAKWPAAHLHVVNEAGGEVIYGRWLGGNDYRATSKLYGAYPRGYLQRMATLFPDRLGSRTLHAFSGSLPVGDYIRGDVRDLGQELVFDVETPHFQAAFDLIYADPPYTKEDAKKYGVRMVNRRKALHGLGLIAAPGAFLVWLDTVWPMHRKDEWRTVGRICLTRSTNHRVRDITIFERQP